MMLDRTPSLEQKCCHHSCQQNHCRYTEQQESGIVVCCISVWHVGRSRAVKRVKGFKRIILSVGMIETLALIVRSRRNCSVKLAVYALGAQQTELSQSGYPILKFLICAELCRIAFYIGCNM